MAGKEEWIMETDPGHNGMETNCHENPLKLASSSLGGSETSTGTKVDPLLMPREVLEFRKSK